MPMPDELRDVMLSQVAQSDRAELEPNVSTGWKVIVDAITKRRKSQGLVGLGAARMSELDSLTMADLRRNPRFTKVVEAALAPVFLKWFVDVRDDNGLWPRKTRPADRVVDVLKDDLTDGVDAVLQALDAAHKAANPKQARPKSLGAALTVQQLGELLFEKVRRTLAWRRHGDEFTEVMRTRNLYMLGPDNTPWPPAVEQGTASIDELAEQLQTLSREVDELAAGSGAKFPGLSPALNQARRAMRNVTALTDKYRTPVADLADRRMSRGGKLMDPVNLPLQPNDLVSEVFRGYITTEDIKVLERRLRNAQHGFDRGGRRALRGSVEELRAVTFTQLFPRGDGNAQEEHMKVELAPLFRAMDIQLASDLDGKSWPPAPSTLEQGAERSKGSDLGGVGD